MVGMWRDGIEVEPVMTDLYADLRLVVELHTD